MDKALYLRLHDLNPQNREELIKEVKRILPAALQEQRTIKLLTIGLFMAIWHSDKPKNQLALNEAITELILSLQPQESKVFISSIAARISKEWNVIDNWRISKYMQFVRLLLEKSFSRFSQDEEGLKWVIQWVVEQLVDRDDEVATHVLDILVESMEKVGCLKIPLFNSFLKTFTCDKLQLQRKVLQKIFVALAKGEPGSRPQLSAILFSFGKQREVRESIRGQIYSLAKWMQSQYESLQEFAKKMIKNVPSGKIEKVPKQAKTPKRRKKIAKSRQSKD